MSKMILVEEETVKQALEALKLAYSLLIGEYNTSADTCLKASQEVGRALEQQPADELDRKACEELNHAEEVLDALSVGLNMEKTDFECIGDYINAVFEAQANKLTSAPRHLVGLTPDEISKALWASGEDGLVGNREDVYLAIEAKLREKNTRPQPAPPVITEGWKLVPVEPTQEMLRAATNYAARTKVTCGRDYFKAMLAAVPEHPAEPTAGSSSPKGPSI